MIALLFGLACNTDTTPPPTQPAPAEPAAEAPPAAVESLILNGERVSETLVVGGQPDQAALKTFQEAGFTTIINLRTPAEMSFDEAALAQELGMTYTNIPVGGAADINPENAAQAKALIDAANGQVLLHCASGGRVGQLRALMN